MGCSKCMFSLKMKTSYKSQIKKKKLRIYKGAFLVPPGGQNKSCWASGTPGWLSGVWLSCNINSVIATSRSLYDSTWLIQFPSCKFFSFPSSPTLIPNLHKQQKINILCKWFCVWSPWRCLKLFPNCASGQNFSSGNMPYLNYKSRNKHETSCLF